MAAHRCRTKAPLQFLVILLTAALCGAQSTPQSKFAPAIPSWKVTATKPVSLLLAFDVDPSLNRESYGKFYDHDVNEFFPQAQCRYRTLMWTRSGDSVRVAADIPVVACPARTGFLYAGFAGYSKAPLLPEKPAAKAEEEENVPVFADCSSYWLTGNPGNIPAEIADKEKALKNSDCGKATEGDTPSNSTDDERISFITPKVLSLRSTSSQITGGAAYFTASESSATVATEDGAAVRLTSFVPALTINRAFRREFRKNGWMVRWGEEVDISTYNFAREAGFTLENLHGVTRLIGLYPVPGNAERQFQGEADLGVAPRSLASFADSGLDYQQFKKIDPSIIGLYASPDHSTVFVLTGERMIVIDTQTRRELFNVSHEILFNKIIMVEWAEGANCSRWEAELNAAGKHVPPQRCERPATKKTK